MFTVVFRALKMTVPAFAGTVRRLQVAAGRPFDPTRRTQKLLLLGGLLLGLLLGFRHDTLRLQVSPGLSIYTR